jgi:hypothetical protein
MKLQDTKGPDDGSMTVIFACPECERKIAMLTNQMETQMVRSLDIKLGGGSGSAQAEPMGTIRSSLAQGHDAFASSHAQVETDQKESGSKCPFTGAVADAFDASGEIVWTQEAEERLGKIPQFARSMAKQGIERHAREKGYREISDAVMEEVRDQFAM